MKRVLLAILMAAAGPAMSQSAADYLQAFSGEWYSFDRARAQNGGVCRVDLTTEPMGNALVAKAENCGAGMDLLGAWGIVDGQIAMLSDDQRVLALMGGNQVRMTGDDLSSRRSLILERRQPSGFVVSLQQAIKSQNCLYIGYTADCSNKEDVSPLLSAKADAQVHLQTATRVNLREQPRRDAPVSLVLDRLTKADATECLTATDGIWCKVTVGETSGWLARNAIRQKKWAVTTFELSGS
ncbi:hypothetical protein HJ526_09345 [Donghicola sp. C2-DW-16]|uniref:SH3 domain-containing protein n=1 Tax=Donghicola mangrovi TaxID=2729614 RepID=A0ABX2PF43_9RHOB|nr:hypothetical protein [Donghicola mangrovi]NVO27622.1 hypothetical protein [Donghicola mangrovi]